MSNLDYPQPVSHSVRYALAMAVVQLLCMTVAYETIRSVRVAVNRHCHISSTNAR